MQIQSTDINFKGGFLFPNMPKTARVQLDNVVKRGKQIFDNFEKEGDVFLVVRDEYDKRIANYVTATALKFKYYPEISTKCGLDCEIHEPLSKLVKQFEPKNELITEMLNPKNKQKIEKGAVDDCTNNIINAVKVQIGNPKIKYKKGLTVVDSENSRYSIIISPLCDGVHYVEVNPKISMTGVSSKMYAIKPTGEIVNEFSHSADSIVLFSKLRRNSLNQAAKIS